MSKFYIETYRTKFQQLVTSALQTGAYVLDVGRGKQFGENQLDGYQINKPNNIEYLTIDVRVEPEPNFVGDLSQLPIKNSAVSLVFIESVLEHVVPVSKLDDCIKEIQRVLIDNGIVVGWAPFCYHFHGGSFPDGTRFTFDGIERLFSEFSDVWIQPCGGPISVLFDSLYKYGYWMRVNVIEEYETKIRFFIFNNFISQYEKEQKNI